MDEFRKFVKDLRKHFSEMTTDVPRLYEVNVDKDVLWNLYLDSFPEGTNKIFRQRREYDCSCCRHFIKSIGNVVVIKNNTVETIWDFDTQSSTYQPVVDALSSYIKGHAVTDMFLSPFKTVGTDHNFEMIDGVSHQWNHLSIELPMRFVETSRLNERKAAARDERNVFKRSLDEITPESLSIVLELISQNSIYRGEEWKSPLTTFKQIQEEYNALSSDKEKELFAWEVSAKVGASISKIRNHSMGTLLVDISEGTDLETAVKKYERIVAPENYKRPKAIFTQKMLDDAKKTIEELGYMDSLSRRYATLDDITVNNILFSNKDSAKRIQGTNDLFEAMAKETVSKPKKFDRAEEISIDKFISDVLPTANELELYLENRHTKNMVSLIAPQNKDSKSMFKWNNNFSWAYTGNMADSAMKERVKAAGGSVDGDLRFSIQWNDTKPDGNDLDAHCEGPDGHIYFGRYKYPSKTRGLGCLDVDIRHPQSGVPAVENITWLDRSSMPSGTYCFYVHNFGYRGGRSGFRAEIEFDGTIYSYDYSKSLRQNENVIVAEVTLHENGTFTIDHKLPTTEKAGSSREVWNLHTNEFVPVSVVMYSPNYWDAQSGIGNRHVFFMLKDCKNPEEPNGMFNEYLTNELDKHKRVFEMLGEKAKVQYVEDQLSGVGFSSTKRAEVVVKVKGQSERILKVKF